MPTIRRATAADIPTLVKLRSEFLSELRRNAHLAGAAWESPANLEPGLVAYLERAIPAEQYVGWLAEEGGEALGMAGCFFFERPPMERPGAVLEGRLVDIYTRPAWRRRGLGAQLVARTVEHARAAGARRLRLGATETGRPLYEQLGFVPVSNEMELRLLTRT